MSIKPFHFEDLVYVPEFHTAMENWGLSLYSRDTLLLDQVHPYILKLGSTLTFCNYGFTLTFSNYGFTFTFFSYGANLTFCYYGSTKLSCYILYLPI